jgi:hypothetical protein
VAAGAKQHEIVGQFAPTQAFGYDMASLYGCSIATSPTVGFEVLKIWRYCVRRQKWTPVISNPVYGRKRHVS